MVKVNPNFQTNVPNIFAIGDIIHGRAQLYITYIAVGDIIHGRAQCSPTPLLPHVRTAARFCPLHPCDVLTELADSRHQNRLP